MKWLMLLMLASAGLLLLVPAGPLRKSSLRVLLDEAGHAGLGITSFVLGSALTGMTGAVLGLLATGTLMGALLASTAGTLLPRSVMNRRRNTRSKIARTAWPDIVDDLSSAVRAGLPLPEAIVVCGTRGPEVIRHYFIRFGDDLRVDGRFNHALDALKAGLADPIADRVIEALRLAREVGGTDLGRLLRDLSESLRANARVREEIEARQSWTVNSARLAVAAPWITLVFLATRREAVAAFNSATGAVVLVVAAGVSVIAYRLMLVLGRLPQEQRVLT